MSLSRYDRLIGSPSDLLLILICLSPVAYSLFPVLSKTNGQPIVLFSLFLSLLAFFITRDIIPYAGKKLLKKLNGVDLGKLPKQEAIPQSLGLLSGTSFLISLILTQTFLPLIYNDPSDILRRKYDSIMLSICFSVLLGLSDDVLDISWGQKLSMGLLSSLPMMTSYDGPTSVLVPTFVRPLILSQPIQMILGMIQCHTSIDGVVLELGIWYLVYVNALMVFCTNAINIYAGVNGLEVGQSLIIACGVAIIDAWELASSDVDSTHYQNHLFSLTVMLPFIATSLALLSHNWFPAKVFIGDVFPYYAGMTFASTAVLGHYSRSLLLLLIPQVLNYIYSLPQLFKLVPCPRHRLPSVMPDSVFPNNVLVPSKVAENDDRPNMTLICLALRIFGPMRERTLTITLLIFQVVCTISFGLIGRYVLSQLLFAGK